MIDIGGGSTEFIIGSGLEPLKLESLYMGCVSFSARYFPDGKITKQNLKQAELAARNELQTIVAEFKGQWQRRPRLVGYRQGPSPRYWNRTATARTASPATAWKNCAPTCSRRATCKD